jgi:hypothetical protein
MDETSIIWMKFVFPGGKQMWSITAIIQQSRMLCVHVWIKFSIIWMNYFFLEENKSEVITAIILQPRMLCVHVWMKFQSFG